MLSFKRLISDRWECEYAELRVEGSTLRYAAGSRLLKQRVAALWAREPATPVWIRSFAPGDVFVDVGASIGLYSIFAAAVAGARVYAFEPESQNYAELNKNIVLNGLHHAIKAYCSALTDTDGVSELYLCAFGAGFGHHDYSRSSWKADLHRGSTVFFEHERLCQGAIGMTLDGLVERGVIPPPNHIKIDVDGWERKVLEGACKTLARPELKTVLVETNFGVHESPNTIALMTEQGWTFSDDQVRVLETEVLPQGTALRLLKERALEQNFIYYRDTEKYSSLFREFASHRAHPTHAK